MRPPARILVASGNAHKRAELGELLAPLGFEVLGPDDVGGLPEVDEIEPTFAGNAALKAVSAATHSGEWALGDDSGLVVDALGGAPGVRSARYAGRHGDDRANNERVLAELAETPPAERGARFVCALVLARPAPEGAEVAARFEGECRGRILPAPRGERGFGYDPLFLFTEQGLPQSGRPFGELSRTEKAAVSHRGRALRALAAHLGALGTPERAAGRPGSGR